MSEYTAPQSPSTAQPRRLTRVREGKMLAGVCTGIARYFDVDPVLVRVGFAALTLLSGAGLLLYIACWIVMPQA
jgi:phage shock protein C